jgi:hypothetical protein
LQIELDELAGLALLRTGNKREGLRKCEEAWAGYSGSTTPSDRLPAALAALEARIENGQRQSALQLFHDIEPVLDGYPELAWRFLALASRLDPAYAARARDVLDKISHQWGETVYNSYLTRPDVNILARPLLRPVSTSR